MDRGNSGLEIRDAVRGMDSEKYQQLLPKGLVLGMPLVGSGTFGRVFEAVDARFDSERPVSRVVRFLELSSGAAAWKTPLLNRMGTMLGLQLPYVGVLRDGGVIDDIVYLVHDKHPHVLSNQLLTSKGISYRAATVITDQLLTGLAGLHAKGVAHGDLRPANVFLSESIGNVGDNGFNGWTWLGDTAIGGLRYWSKGDMLSSESSGYFPPEWNGDTHEPCPKADLYALGVVVCELLLGADAVNNARKKTQDSQGSLWKVLKPKLQRRKVGGTLWRWVELLLANVEDRPANASDLLRRQQRSQENARRIWFYGKLAVGIILAVCLILSLVFWSRSRQSTADLRRESDQIRIEKDGIAKERDVLHEKLDHAKMQIAKLETRSGKLPGPSGGPQVGAIERAKAWWGKQNWDLSGGFLPVVKRIESAVQILDKEDHAAAEEAKKWIGVVRGQNNAIGTWLKSDTDLKELSRPAIEAPWDPAKLSSAENRLKALRTAAEKWDKWATDSKFKNHTAAEIMDLIELETGPDASILKKWLGDVKASKQWQLRLIRGVAPEGFGTYRRIAVKGTTLATGSFHNWDADTGHDYTKTPDDDRLVTFDWTMGEPIAVGMEGSRNLWIGGYRNYLLYDNSTTGPLAIWWLHSYGKSSDDAGFVLEYEVPNCPGPPRNWRPDPAKAILNFGGK